MAETRPETSQKVTLLVYAWDNYAPAWKGYCHGITKYWSDCPYDLLFITNYLTPPCGRAVKVGDENRFYYKMALALNEIKTPIILFMHDDYWIKQPVNTAAIQRYSELILSDKADYIRLIPAPGPDRDCSIDDKLGLIDSNAEYRLSFMASLWRVSTLRELMKPELSLWEMERYGVQLTNRFIDRFFCVKDIKDGIAYDLTAITARQWTKVAYSYAENEGIEIDFDALPLPPLDYRLTQASTRLAYRIKRRTSKYLRRTLGKLKTLPS